MNKAFRVVLLGVEDVVGKQGMTPLLRSANLTQYIDNYPNSDTAHGGHELAYMGQINRALFDLYGKRGARAILNRVGRGRAKSAIEENAMLANATKVATKFLSLNRKVKLTLDTAAKTYSEQLSTTIHVREEGNTFFWEDATCGNCMGMQSGTPACYTTAGFLHGLLAWILDCEDFKVEEIACHAMGDAVCRHKVTLG
ncbi:MAG: hypothetical protein HY868_13125 [Chloroflexi bacterium]|nr:hypothetical protein [Chloroflexota bacterium]